ncbi:cobalt-precorrin 3 C17-methyltransferase [Anoxybacillus vitaminiphilus]|uniref:Cobalt-precorrin 3 C17-methyltransferase n=1 Tax=Paranoxybacillus vitaminiphilus TaxID=581036 RepID=A0A327YMT0_9BACL|nr:precorrin-3B C(17)-methyltransferase [Anoxybacillus vitaminiphilus]RAK19549.1 cobalt-precorrin 3 C17-methyltransferase [Anoxybacillus vitaminiphilus]
MSGKLFVIGFGPGSADHMTKRAREAIEESEVIIGYKTYVDLVRDLLANKEIISTGMTEEVSRAQAAVKQAESGKKVAVISSGDAGVYGMAGLIYEVLAEKGWKKETGVEVEVIPGISAIQSCAALLGAPVMHDACTISLSDHLTPWAVIAKRIEAAAQADFVIAFYNPKSGRRTRQIVEARTILLRHRSPKTPVGLVKSAYRERQHIVLTDLENMLEHDIGMLTTVIVGNSSTFVHDGVMITPRGYKRKYTLTAAEQPLKPHERLRREAEPWALEQTEPVTDSLRSIAEEALQRVEKKQEDKPISAIFEVAVCPQTTKQFTAQQLMVMAEVTGKNGVMKYTPDHYMKLEVETDNPQKIVERLKQVGLTLLPVGNVLTLKTCDFCDGEKKESIPYAEEIRNRFNGMEMPKELKIGFNGCGMACYGAVHEDIGIVYRKGAFDLFLGAKTVGRDAHPGQLAAEGISPEKLLDTIEKIITEYKEKAHPNERFYKFFKRVGHIAGFAYEERETNVKVQPLSCGD